MASKPSHFPLDISKLNFVLQVLRHYNFPEARWFDFGLSLGLLHPTLEAIESAHRDPSRCLIECLNKWLTKADDNVTTVGPIIWKTLANALHGMNAKSISSDIRKTMADPVSEILQCFIGRLAQVALTEESVDLLHTEGLISKDALTEVKSCGCSLVGDPGPMLLILSAVAEDHSKLRTLTSILMKSKEAVSLASDIIMEYEKSLPSAVTVMPSCQEASTSTSSRSGQLQDSSSKTQVTTNTDATAQGVVEVIVNPGYKAEFERMGDRLAILIDPLIKAAIPSSIPSVDHLKGISYQGREADESNKSSIQSSESEKEESKKTTEKMQMEIDHLRLSLQSKTETLIGVEKTLTEREKEIEQLQEKISLMDIQLKETSITLRKDQPLKYIDQPKGVYVATKDWELEENNQLSIKEGEKFEVKEERTNEWWLARSLDTDKEGLVPSCLIKIDEESELSTSEALELFYYAMTENVDIPQIKKVKTSNNGANLFLTLIKQDSVLLDQFRKEHGKPKAIRWYDDGVQLTSPSLIQCQEVVSLLTSKHRSIRIIKSSPYVVYDLLPVLLQNENVKSLTIRDTQLTQDCISSLCNLLANNKSLEGLYFCNCSIDDKAVADVTNVLLQNNTLKGLSFQRNTLITSAISQNLSELIKNLILEVLDVAGTSISSDGILLILQSLLVNMKLKLYLHIDDKDICTEYRDYNIIKDRVFFY